MKFEPTQKIKVAWMIFVGFFFLHALLYLRYVSDKFLELKEDIIFKTSSPKQTAYYAPENLIRGISV